MQWVLLAGWVGFIWLGTHTLLRTRYMRIILACALAASMLTQLALLQLDGLLMLETALPLHLCGLFGVLSIPLLWHAPALLWEASVFLAAPAALCTLFFPAVMPCSHPRLMQAAFYQLHVLVGLVPLFLYRTGKPLPTDPKRTFWLGNGYLLFIGAFNHAFQTNYLFFARCACGYAAGPAGLAGNGVLHLRAGDGMHAGFHMLENRISHCRK